MRPTLLLLSLALGPLSAISFAALAVSVADDPDGRELLVSAERTINAYHEGHRNAKSVLRIVYFHPADRDPLPNYAERLDRIMSDVSNFYRDGLRRFGLENDGLPLERKDGRLVLHLVRGQKPASGYQHESGNQTAAEIRAALKGVFDVDREHVLVIYALCRKEADGRYVFDAPYYGGGTARAGLFHAADCELLDPQLLTATNKKIVYTEHYYPRMEQTVARFNSWYLGGIAHELGHGLGLDHDSASPTEQRFGTSLMGGGNHTYRQELWGGGKPSFLSRGSALQLAAHPLFTGSNRGRWDKVGAGFERLEFRTEGGKLRITGKASGDIPPYAVVAYTLPVSAKTDHGSLTYPAGLKDGQFEIEIAGLPRTDHSLWLATLHVNGGVWMRRLPLGFDAAGQIDIAALKSAWLLQQAETAVLSDQSRARELLTDDAIARAALPELQRKLRILRAVIDPPAPLQLANVTTDRVFLSDVEWDEASVGWGKVARNHYWFDDKNQNGAYLMLKGTVYEKGLYAHSASRYSFALDAKWKTFTATIGLRDGANAKQGSAVFKVLGDGRELYCSPLLRPGTREDVKINIAGVKNLELLADGGEGHNFNSWAI